MSDDICGYWQKGYAYQGQMCCANPEFDQLRAQLAASREENVELKKYNQDLRQWRRNAEKLYEEEAAKYFHAQQEALLLREALGPIADGAVIIRSLNKSYGEVLQGYCVSGGEFEITKSMFLNAEQALNATPETAKAAEESAKVQAVLDAAEDQANDTCGDDYEDRIEATNQAVRARRE